MYPLKSLSAKKTDFENIAAGRQETETVLEGVAVGGYLGMKHRNGLFGEAGLEYQRINERFDLSSVVTDTIGKIAVIGIIIHAPGDTTFISDSVAVLRETRFVKRTYNNYRFLQVPLAIGYECLRRIRRLKGSVDGEMRHVEKEGLLRVLADELGGAVVDEVGKVTFDFTGFNPSRIA